MAERINLVPGSEDGVRAAAAVVFSRPHGREDCEEEQAHRRRRDVQDADADVRRAYKLCTSYVQVM